MIFNQPYARSGRTAILQLNERDRMRNAANDHEMLYCNQNQRFGLVANAGIVPQDVYQEFDNTTVEVMQSDNGDTFLNDLMPLARPVNVGRLNYVTRRSSMAGTAQTSMTGQIGIKMDQVEYNNDRTIIPVHDAGFYRNWRELSAQRAEDFDALVDDNREITRQVRIKLVDTFMDGHVDTSGNNIVGPDGADWQGMRNDSRVVNVDLGAGGVNFDFTLSTNDGDANKDALITVLDNLWITNNCEKDVTVYISREISRNWERNFSSNYDGRLIIDQLAKLKGVASIKISSKLSGNQLMAFPLDGSVRPISGMAMSTIALPRQMYNSNHEFVVATAVGWFVTTDFDNRSCALYAED